MENKKTNDSNASDRELLLTRTFNAPIELVWEVWKTGFFCDLRKHERVIIT